MKKSKKLTVIGKARTTAVLVAALLMLISTGTVRVSAQQKVDKASETAAAKKVREQSRVPLGLPTVFPYSPFSTARDRRKTLYASATVVDEDGFQFNYCFSKVTCHSAYFYAEIAGEKISADAEKPVGKTVKLARGLTGYFSESSCGASCAPDSITWDERGFRYTVFLETNGDVKTLANFVNSIIENSPAGGTEK